MSNHAITLYPWGDPNNERSSDGKLVDLSCVVLTACIGLKLYRTGIRLGFRVKACLKPAVSSIKYHFFFVLDYNFYLLLKPLPDCIANLKPVSGSCLHFL